MTRSLIYQMLKDGKTTVDIARALGVSIDRAAELIKLFIPRRERS